MAKAAQTSNTYTPRMKALYTGEIRDNLMKELAYKNVMQLPKIQKIVLNMGVGQASQDKKLIDFALDDMRRITGQQPVVTHARKSIAGFKIREGMPIGCKVTLRGQKMYDFLDRLITIALPRVRDFEGVPNKSFDGNGNYSLGIKEQIIFPEIDFDKTNQIRGMDVVIATSAKTDKEAKALLSAFGMPFRKKIQ